MAKRGPKPKINAVVERDIIACLSVGATLRDCAQYCGIGYRTLMEKRKNDPKFRTRTKQAEIKGKVYHLKKIKNAPQWQASAFILERKWWKEFGRRDVLKQTFAGTLKAKHTVDLSGFNDDELIRLERAFASGSGGTDAPGRN